MKFKINNLSIWILLIVLGIIIRLSLLNVSTGDYLVFLQPWIDFIKSHGYFSSLKYNFYDYTPTYIYILIFIAKTGLNPLYLIKIVSFLFELITAYYVGKIVELKYPGKNAVLKSIAIISLIPTVILNSSYLSQCDSIYTAFIIGSIYYTFRKKNLHSIFFLGVAFIFKMQAVFILPFYFVLMLKGNIRWYVFLIIPFVFVLSLLPAYYFGRPFSELIGIYFAQTDRYHFLTLNFPNLYIWISNNYYEIVKPAGIIITSFLTIGGGFYLKQKKYNLTIENLIRLAFLSSIVVPFILPGMHERYMYMGDILGVLYFFVIRKNWYFPVSVILVSTYSYIRCSRFNDILPIEPSFFIYFAIIILALSDFYKSIKTVNDDNK